MVKVILGLLALAPCVAAVREQLAADLGTEDGPQEDAKCNAACPGTRATKTGWLFGGAEECMCEDEGFIIADQHGEVQWQYDASLDANYNSFKYEKKGFFRDSKCMPCSERRYRESLGNVHEALKFKKTETAAWQFLGVSYHANALISFATAARGDCKREAPLNIRSFDCSGREFRTPELDAACTDGMVAVKQHYQTESKACLEAVRGLERAKQYIDGAAFTKAAALLSEAVKVLKEQNSRDAAMDLAGQTRAAMLGIVQGLLPTVEENIPPF